MPQTRLTLCTATFLSAAIAAPSLAADRAAGPADLRDLHLNTVPRTKAEAARIAPVLAAPTDFTAPERFEENPGGAATVRARTNADAFSQPSGNISFERELDFKVGNGLFRKIWVPAPASTRASDGLGPLYNARGCQNCHIKDGRGHVPEGPDDSAVSMFLRVSVPADAGADMPAIADWIATAPEPTYGGQIQDFAIAGHAGEGRMRIDWQEVTVELSGGETVMLRRPAYMLADAAYGPLDDDAMLSPRIAPQMIGLGLLEAIPTADVLALADPDDADGDGISGRPAIVWSPEFDTPMLGRFGWKGGTATVREQSAAAFAGDMGLSTSLFPDIWGDCSDAQADCRAAPGGQGGTSGTAPADDGDPTLMAAADLQAPDYGPDDLEVDDQALDLVTFYSRNLAVPARRAPGDPKVLRGKQMFHTAQCAACHTPKHVTHRLQDQPEQSFQLIWPHTDLLLHDMGEGLADNRPEGRATGREWKTPPLWGIGLTRQVSGHEAYLHDGRARTLLEAILWHGGEAQAARDAVASMNPPDRAALIRYLESL